MWRHRVVLVRDREDDAQVVFVNKNEPAQFTQVYYMPQNLFEEMGKPDTITVTVETGDRLN